MAHCCPLRSTLGLAVLTAVLVAGGCAPKIDDADLVLAEVGDRQITAEYYKHLLGRLQPQNLPRGDDGQPMEMIGMEGKRAFLEVIIDKELMVAKAVQTGYLNMPWMVQARESITESIGIQNYWRDHGRDQGEGVSQDQIDHYYSRLGESRRCNYLIAFTREEAQAARQALLDGVPWLEVASRYHHAPLPGGRVPEQTISWGQSHESLQRPVFAVDKGGVTEVFETSFGWWVIQVLDIKHQARPDLDDIVDEIRSRINAMEDRAHRERAIKDIKKQRNFQIDPDAVRIIFDGLPEYEPLLDPETRKPTPREQLNPLQIPTTEYDRVLLSYDRNTGPVEQTLIDYKVIYDQLVVFDRPKKQQGLLFLRSHLVTPAAELMVADEAVRLGYMDGPDVQQEVFRQLEEYLVNHVNQELVRYDEDVPMQEIESYYEEREDAFWREERRHGSMIRVETRDRAHEVRLAWMNDTLDRTLEPTSIGPLNHNPSRPLNAAIFQLAVGEISEPIELQEDWCIIRLDTVMPREKMPLKEVQQHIIGQIRNRRHDRALRRLLDEWREEFGVKIYENRLAEMPSWDEVRMTADREPLP